MRYLLGAHSGMLVPWFIDEAAVASSRRSPVPIGTIMRQIYNFPLSPVPQLSLREFTHINTVHKN